MSKAAIDRIRMTRANLLFSCFREKMERTSGMRSSKGKNSAESPGKSFQLKGYPSQPAK